MTFADDIKELFVVIFPCGSFRASRTETGAWHVGGATAKERTCCAKGHSTFRVEHWQPVGVLKPAHTQKKAVVLRLVK